MRYATNPLSPPAAQIYKTQGTHPRPAGEVEGYDPNSSRILICLLIHFSGTDSSTCHTASAAGETALINLFINVHIQTDIHQEPGSNTILNKHLL
jgi:hypothetical protein